MPRTTWTKVLGIVLAAVLLATACGGDDDDNAGAASSAPSTAAPLDGSINVFAASSLTGAFSELAKQFENANPGTSVESGLNFAGSSDLVNSIQEGAPADAFASADESNMQKLVDAGSVEGTAQVFARNQLAIAVEPGNPLGITSLADLAHSDVKVVLCDSSVPCGKYADQALSAAGVTVTPVSREANVKDTLGKVGEADAAVVYVTDVKSDSQVEGVAIPPDQNVIATLPIASLKDASNPELAAAWVEYVMSPQAQQILQEDFGFLAP
jgi:molybdate transport system substrate-binding protein